MLLDEPLVNYFPFISAFSARHGLYLAGEVDCDGRLDGEGSVWGEDRSGCDQRERETEPVFVTNYRTEQRGETK